ncbi:MAG: subtilase-type protease inhibitor [Actinomycetota bacterium]|jgi:hypothetical protein|nr:subtilase-type protease inhibitor [Actinomycetota bacterium]
MTPGDDGAATRLTVAVRDDTDSAPRTWTLSCDPPGGDHPDPGGACRALTRTADAFAPVPPDRMCTQQYGGPATATVEGVWKGRPVSARYNRTDGCEIARWKAIAAVLSPPETRS